MARALQRCSSLVSGVSFSITWSCDCLANTSPVVNADSAVAKKKLVFFWAARSEQFTQHDS
jgi:hypothetical protein